MVVVLVYSLCHGLLYIPYSCHIIVRIVVVRARAERGALREL